METKTVPLRRSIRRRTLRALLGVAGLTAVSFAIVTLFAVRHISEAALGGNTKLGAEAVRVSKASLDTVFRREMLGIAASGSAVANARLARVRARTDAVAAHATLLLRHSSPASSTSANAYQELRPFLHYAQAADRDIEYMQFCDVTGVFLNDPQAGQKSSDFALGWLAPYPTVLKPSFQFPKNYNPRTELWYRDAIRTGAEGWSAPQISAISGHLDVACYAPVFGPDRRRVAVVAAQVPIATLDRNLIQDRPNGSQTILVRNDLQMIARIDTTKDSQTTGLFALDAGEKAQSRLAAEVAANRVGLLRGLYQGVPTYVAYSPIFSTKWALLTLLPVEVVDQPLHQTERSLAAEGAVTRHQINEYVAMIFGISILIFAILAALIIVYAERAAGRIVAPIQSLDQSAKVLATGDLDHRVELTTGDELEELADSFNQMGANLKRYMTDLAESTAAKERIQSELAVASQIQRALLPRTFPAFPDRPEFDLYAVMDPAKEVGGDFYDFFFVDDRHLCFLIADVSDKGVPAALYMMVAKTLLKTAGLRGLTPDQMLSHVNNQLAPDNENLMFVTVLCAILNIETGELQVSNAGHNPLFLCTSEGVRFLPAPPGFVLGPMANSPYKLMTTKLAPGDLILFYTDGVTEAKNSVSALFGNQRLNDCVSQCADSDVATVIRHTVDVVQEYSTGVPQADDITLLGLRFITPYFAPEVKVQQAMVTSVGAS